MNSLLFDSDVFLFVLLSLYGDGFPSFESCLHPFTNLADYFPLACSKVLSLLFLHYRKPLSI